MDLEENDRVLLVVLPSASKKLDCGQIAFALSNGRARYFTEELCEDLDGSDRDFYDFVCEWELDDDGGCYKHINYGPLKGGSFTGMVMEIIKDEEVTPLMWREHKVDFSNFKFYKRHHFSE